MNYHMESSNALTFRNRNEWRKWLEKNHKKEKEVWLIHYKKHAGKIGIQLEEAVGEAICFGWIDGKLKNRQRQIHTKILTPQIKQRLVKTQQRKSRKNDKNWKNDHRRTIHNRKSQKERLMEQSLHQPKTRQNPH